MVIRQIMPRLSAYIADCICGNPSSGKRARAFRDFNYVAGIPLAELSLRRKEFDEAAKYINMFDKVYPYHHFCGNEWQAYDYYRDWMLAKVYEGKGDVKNAIQTLLPDAPESGLADNTFIVEYLNGLLLREYTFAEIKAAVTSAVKNAKKKGKGDDAGEEIILFGTKMVFGGYGGGALKSDPFIKRYL